MATYTLDFEKLDKQGIPKAKTLDFLRNKTQHNFNIDELESLYKNKGYTQEETTNAIYDNLVKFKTLSLSLKDDNPANTTQPQPQQAQTQPLFISKSDDFSASDFKSFQGGGEGSLLNINDRADTAESLKSTAKTSPTDQKDNAETAKTSPTDKGFWEGILERGIGYETDNVKAFNTQADKLLRESVKQGKDLKDLSGIEKQRLYELYNDNKGFFDFDSMKASLEKEYNRLKERQKILQISDPKDLSQEQREIISQDEGFWNNAWDYFFTDEKEILKNYQEKTKAKEVILPETQKALEFLNNIHQAKDIKSALLGADEKTIRDYKESVYTIATNFGFDGIGFDEKNDVFFKKDAEWYKVNDGFFDNFTHILQANAGTIGGGLAGAAYGFKLGGKDPRKKLVGGVIGGAIGSFTGGAADVLITNAYLDRENTAKEIVAHATQEGLMSVVGDVAFMGVSKGVKSGIKAFQSGKAKDIGGKILEYTPIVGMGTKMLNGNAKAAQKLIDTTYTKEQQQTLKDFGENFGGNITFSNQGIEATKDSVAKSFGSDSKAYKAFSTISDILTLPSQNKRQQAFIQAIRADESGHLIAFLSEAAAQSPKANENLRQILNLTTHKLQANLENLQLNRADIKTIFDEMEKGTKQSYDEAINSLIAKIYNDTYKVNLNELKKGSQEQSNKQSFKSFKESLESQGIPIENEVKSFINFVEKNIYNENGVTFTQLNNALKTLNAYYKQATDPNFKSHIKNATESFLRDDIKAGIEAIFSQNKTAYKDVTSLYETALKDYANMKSTLKLVDSIKLRDIKTTHDLALDSLLKLAKGQGDELDNISTLTKALDSQNRAVIELNMLQSLFTKSLYDKDMLQVFDSGKFFDELNKLHTNTFQSKAAKDFIELAQGFHTLFKNDVLIAQSLKPTTTQAIGSSIATSIEGAVRFQFVKELFSHIIRLMPKIPFATALNEKVSGAALRYHIKSALQKSYSVSDFKNTLDSKVAKVPFDNQTRAYMRDLSKNIEKIQDEIIDYNKQLLDQEAKAADYFAQAQAKKDEMIALKEARLGKNADEVPLHKGQDIPYKPLRDTSIVLSDELPPFEAEFAVVRLSDIKPNFDNSNTQGRLIKQESVIANIVNDFKPELMFYQEGGVNGVPIITRDGKVVSGNHRSEALKQIIDSHNNATQAAREQYKKSAKEFLGVDLQDNEIIVRRLKENMSDKQILQLAFSSNIGRESTMGEKALSTLSLYRQNIATLPKLLQSENVNELKSLVAKHIDKQGNGLNTFDTNLALLTSLAKNGKNSNILQSLDSIKGNSEYKNKIINMYVDNAGSFYNLANNPSFKNLEFRDILSDAMYYTARQNPTRQLDYEYLIQEIESFLNLAKDKEALKNALVLDSNKVQNLTAQAFGLALAKFSRQENPSSALYEALKQAPKALELATQPTFFTQGKALSEVDIYDFLEYLINQGQITQSQSVLSSLMPRLRELRESIANPQSSVLRGESGETQGIKELESSAESTPPNLNTKTTSKLSSQELKDLPIATQDEYKDFLQKIANKDYANTPEILKITTLNRDLQALINHNQSADVFITRARAGHISESRKGEYNQALSLEEQEQIPAVIHQAKEAYTGGGNGYVVPFNDTHNANKVNLIVLNSDEKGNFLITAKKINKSDFENPMYQKLARAGVEPATTTPPKAEQKPTEAISPARDEIIPQNPQFKDKIDLEKFYEAKARALENELINNPISKEEALNKIKNHSKETDKAYENFHKTLGLEVEGYPMSMYVNSSVIPYLKEPIVYNTKPKTANEIKRERQLNARIAKLEQSRERYKQVLDTEKELNFLQNFQPKTAKEKQIVKTYFKTLQKAEQEINNSYFDKTSNIIKLQEIRNRLFAGKDFLTANILSLYAAKGTNLDNAFKDFRFKSIMRGEFGEYVKEYNITQARQGIEYNLNINPIKEFGANYAEYYRDGVGAIQKLLAEAQAHKQSGAKGEYKGQVAGAFHRDDIGDITLAWGDKGTGKSDGWGLSKIAEYHPEVLDKLDKLIQDLPIVKETENRYKLDNGNFFISIRKDFEGQKQNWVLTALERDESIARRRTDLPSSQSEAEKTTSANATAIIPQNNAVDTKWQEAELKNNLFENMKKFNETFNTPFEIAQKYHYIKDKIQNFEALPPTLTETKFFENYQGLVSKFLKKNLRVVPSIYDEKGELINLYKLNERVNSFSELEKFKNSLENKSYSALGILMPLKDSKTLDELKEVLTGLNTFLQKQHKKLNKDYVKNYESKKLEAQQARKELDEIETIFKIEADGTLKGYAEAMYNKLESLRNSRNEIVQEILKLDKGLASLKTLENRFNEGEFYNFLQDIISLREKADMSLYEKEKARKRIEEALNITPIKEFGTNYAEHYHSGQTAIQKLLAEAQAHKQSGAKGEYKGQVAGAFYRKELGDIDLVWGDSNFGLAHILQERTKQWGEEKALRFISHLSENIQKGHIVEVEKGRIGIKTELTTIILDKKDGNNFVITAFRDSGNKKELESLNLIQSKALTSENAGTNAKESPVTSLNQESIIPQTPQEIIKQAKEQGKSVAETAENNTNAWQKEFIEKIKNDESGKILGHYTQGEALVIERKINDKDLDLISITKGENGELFTTYLGKFITRQEAQKRKSFLDNGFKGKEKDLLEFLEKEPVNIGSERIAFIPTLDKFFGISSFNGEYFTEFFIHKHFADSKEPFTSMSLGQGKLETAEDNLGRYIDKLFKDNGHPFGFLINNEKTMQRLAKDKELYNVKSKGAIETLLTAKMGHIQGAFHRKELGDIDLVWGDSNFGLKHILDKHGSEFKDIAKELDEIIQNGEVVKNSDRATLQYTKENGEIFKVGLKANWKGEPTQNKWIITAYKDEREMAKTINSSDFTKGETLPLNSSDIIPQTTQKSLFDTQEPTPPKVDSSESKTKHEQREQTKAILTPTEAREIIPKQIFNFDDNGYLLKELTRQEVENLSKDSREMLEYFNKVFDGLDSIKVKQHIKDTYTDAQKGYNHLRRVNNRIYEDILQEYLKNKFKHNQLAKNIDEYGEYVEEYYTKMMDNLKSLEEEKKIFKELERIDAIVKNENETPAQKVDSSVESHTKHQDYNTFNQSLKDAHDFFKANNKDAYNDKLFDDVIKVANALDIRFWYQPNAVYMAGSYTYRLNRIMLQSDNFSKENANTMLHELIHSVTSRAIYAYDNKALREKLSEKQIEAITELKNLYKEVSENNADKVWQKMATFKDELEHNKEGKLYGLKNEHEMLAELANPSFREFLKEQNIFSKIIEAMAKIFSYVKDKLTGESIKSTNAQSELETILYKIMDNYTNPHAFTNEMSEHFGSRNFVDTARYKEYIKDHKQKFDKDNYKGKHIFSFTEGMNFYNRSAISGKERFFQNFINNAYFDEKDFDIVQKLKWQMMDPVKRPANFMELKTEKNAHIFEEVEKTHENNIKSLVKEYYGVSYDEFNNAFNGAMKDKHFYEVKNATPQEMLRDKTST